MHVVVLSTDRLLAFGSACVTLPPLASESVSNSAVVPEAPPQPKPAEKPRVVVHESGWHARIFRILLVLFVIFGSFSPFEFVIR
jgi:hypothetical protein